MIHAHAGSLQVGREEPLLVGASAAHIPEEGPGETQVAQYQERQVRDHAQAKDQRNSEGTAAKKAPQPSFSAKARSDLNACNTCLVFLRGPTKRSTCSSGCPWETRGTSSVCLRQKEIVVIRACQRLDPPQNKKNAQSGKSLRNSEQRCGLACSRDPPLETEKI